ncbi:hypothetical protein BJ165DRAFT_1535137 [Panaeolus papilionaceus]|nr:hypothetical protein BJ165DRAFT_1535137 [Panaeolus papilionaceus]
MSSPNNDGNNSRRRDDLYRGYIRHRRQLLRSLASRPPPTSNDDPRFEEILEDLQLQRTQQCGCVNGSILPMGPPPPAVPAIAISVGGSVALQTAVDVPPPPYEPPPPFEFRPLDLSTRETDYQHTGRTPHSNPPSHIWIGVTQVEESEDEEETNDQHASGPNQPDESSSTPSTHQSDSDTDDSYTTDKDMPGLLTASEESDSDMVDELDSDTDGPPISSSPEASDESDSDMED